jgi:hypothetical protein
MDGSIRATLWVTLGALGVAGVGMATADRLEDRFDTQFEVRTAASAIWKCSVNDVRAELVGADRAIARGCGESDSFVRGSDRRWSLGPHAPRWSSKRS